MTVLRTTAGEHPLLCFVLKTPATALTNACCCVGQGKQGKLRGRTFSAPRKWARGKGRITCQFGCCYNYAVDSEGRKPGVCIDSPPTPPFLGRVCCHAITVVSRALSRKSSVQVITLHTVFAGWVAVCPCHLSSFFLDLLLPLFLEGCSCQSSLQHVCAAVFIRTFCRLSMQAVSASQLCQLSLHGVVAPEYMHTASLLQVHWQAMIA